VRQGKSNYNICGIRLDCGSDVVQEYGLKYDRAFNSRNLFKIDNFIYFLDKAGPVFKETNTNEALKIPDLYNSRRNSRQKKVLQSTAPK